MLGLRAVVLNGEWDDFQAFYRQKQSLDLHPHRHALQEIHWPTAA